MAFIDGNKMRIITGDSHDDCERKLEKLYGNNARIVEYRTDFKYYFFHLFKRPFTEAKYILNNPSAFEKPEYSQPVYKAPSVNTYNHNYSSSSSGMTDDEISRQKILEQNSNFLISAQINNKLDEKLDDFTATISKQIDDLRNSTKSLSEAKPETIQKIEEILQENEFSFSYIQMIEEKINSTFTRNQLQDFDLIQRYVVDWIGETISVTKEKVFRPPHTYVLVGPTGVGKTTTLTKLMALSIMKAKKEGKQKPKGCIVTIDNIRAGAFDQLKKLGDAVEYPVLKAMDSEDVNSIYTEYKDHVNNIFIDTAGCSPNDSEHLGAMKTILDVKMNPDVYLTVTATTKCSDLAYIFRNYEPFGYDNVIITKIDESRQIGNVISVLWEKRKSVAFLTNGQHPKNIKQASVIEILKCLTGFDVDRVHLEDKFGEEEYAD